MQRQKQSGWREQGQNAQRKVVLNADPGAYEAICTKGRVLLRLFYDGGSSIMLGLESTDRKKAERDRGEPGILSITVDGEGLLKCIDSGMEIVFYNPEYHEAAHFRIASAAKDFWLSGMRPMEEHIQ